MKKAVIVLFLMAGWLLCTGPGCEPAAGNHTGYWHKDLSEQMDALAILQGAIGEDIRRGRTEEAMWLVDGLDSVMQLIVQRLNNHHRLEKPFEYYYKTKMKEPLTTLRLAIRGGDTATAHEAYRLLVRRCNSCHNVHEVEERAHY